MEATIGYAKWRATITTDPYATLVDALQRLSTTELQEAYTRLIPGLATERLNPIEASGDFHLAAGLIQGTLYLRKHAPKTEPTP